MYIFISHSSADAEIAQELCEFIESKGSRCFLAPRDIRPGCEYAAEIAEGVDRSDAILLILSNASNQSPHVLREVERAVTKSIPILVYKIEDVTLTKSMEYFLMTHQWMNAKKNTYDDIIVGIENLKKSSVEKESRIMKSVDSKAERENVKSGKRKKKLVAAIIAFAAILVVGAGAASVAFYVNEGYGEMTENSSVAAEVELGDTVLFGTYNDADIRWRVLKLSANKSEAVLVAANVLTVKAYDAPESGRYNYNGDESFYGAETEAESNLELQAYVRGDSSWKNSTIRTWLNSSDENVKFIGQAPVSSAMADNCNGYNAEPGFLCGFTEEERSAIKETAVETKGNALCETNTVVTEDKVFLLSMEELEWFEEANISLLAEPTPEAIAKDEAYWYKDYCLEFGVEATMWWLREPVESSSSQCYLVGNGWKEENIYTWETGVESFGIRPVITVDLTKGYVRTEEP